MKSQPVNACRGNLVSLESQKGKQCRAETIWFVIKLARASVKINRDLQYEFFAQSCLDFPSDRVVVFHRCQTKWHLKI